MSDFLQRTEELVDAGRYLHGRDMVPATSGNFSARLSNGTFNQHTHADFDAFVAGLA